MHQHRHEWNPAAELQAMADSHGVKVTDALRRAGENTATFRRWRERTPATAQVFNRIAGAIRELAAEKTTADR